MTSQAQMREPLSGGSGANGEDVFRLAVMLEKKLLLLEGMQQRQRVRKDPRLAEHGIGFHQPVQERLEKNWRLIIFLAESALGFGFATPEVYRLLARGLFEVAEYEKSLRAADEARERDMLSAPLAELRLSALLELGRAREVQELLRPGAPEDEDSRFISVTDYPAFEDWCVRVGAERVALVDEPVAAEGALRFLMDEASFELDNRIRSTPLAAARVKELEVLAGYVPFKAGAGYYDAGLISNLKELAPVQAVSRSRVAFRPDAVEGRGEAVRFAGNCLVPTAAHQYYGNYFHALCQICCRLVAALDSGRLPQCRVLLPEATPKWALQFLEMLGVGPERIGLMPARGVCRVEQAFVLPMKWDVCPAEIAHARSRLLASAPPAAVRKNYYLLRRNVQNFTRALVDEERFIRVCQDRGFEVVDPLDYSLHEQVELFRDAGILVSGASSAYTNMLFARPGLEMVLILPRLFWGMLSSDLATACGHTLTTVLGEFVAGSRSVSNPHHPYAADPDLLAAHLDRLLAS